MKPELSHYLELQFSVKIFTLSTAQFQPFFESILERKYEDFERIRTYGNRGDGGNDGYRKENGIYYQVYSPLNPESRDKEASKKMRDDFLKLHKKWNHVTQIKEFNFVFNDKFLGVSILLKEMLATLESDFPDILFKIITAEKIRKLFISLQESDLAALNFNLSDLSGQDSKHVSLLVSNILDSASIEIDRENIRIATSLLDSCRNMLPVVAEEALLVRHTVLDARCKQKEENWGLAQSILDNLLLAYPRSILAIKSLADLHLALDNSDRNRELINRASEIDDFDDEVILSKILRSVHLENTTDEIDKQFDLHFTNPRTQARYLRLVALNNCKPGKIADAKLAISKAIDLNPDFFELYRINLEIQLMEYRESSRDGQRLESIRHIHTSLHELLNNFGGFDLLPVRVKANILRLKMDIYYTLGDSESVQEAAIKLLEACKLCYLNSGIQFLLSRLLISGILKYDNLISLCDNIKLADSTIGNDLLRALVLQFNLHKKLNEEARQFFSEIGADSIVEFISKFESRDIPYLRKEFEDDPVFGVAMIDSVGQMAPEIETLIKHLNIDEVTKKRVRFHILCESKDYSAAFDIAKEIDPSIVGLYEIDQFLEVASKAGAWDSELQLIDRLEEFKGSDLPIRYLLIQLKALLASGDFTRAISAGKKLLLLKSNDELLNIKNRKSVYNNILMACFERSKSDPKYLDEAMTLVTMHDGKLSNFTSSISFVPEVYMARGEFGKALESIVSAIESKNGLNQSEYARLFFSVCIRIGEHVNSDDFKLPVVTDGSYVQLKGEDQWYRVGGENSLDAIHIKSESHLYEEFRHKKLEDPIRFVSEFERTSSHDVVSSILTREGYIFQKIRNAFQKLSQKDLIPGVRLFSIKEIDGKIDSEHLTRTLKSITNPDNSVFDIYREQAVPFAFLAKAEGGFNNALGKIIGESAGYINFSDGTVRDFGDQVARAKKLLTTKSDAYLDGTSAVFLSEFSIFCRVLSELPNLKVPRSVVRLLTGLAHKFSSADSSKGSLSVRQGKIVYSEHDKARNLTVHQSLLEAIKNCEEENGRIAQISDAYKSKDMIESLLPSELVDASILARKHHFQLITDDSHYLRASELVLGYEKLDHISSLALIRAMYELGRINFLKYLEYFGFLSNYRLRFLSISPEDIKKALFGDGLISDFRPELLDHFNLPVTLSEEYGVSPDELIRVLSYVILDLIMDDTICIDVFGRVAIEIMARTPQKSCKLRTLNSIIERCDSGLARTLQNLTIQLNPAPFQKKLDRLKYSRSLYKV